MRRAVNAHGKVADTPALGGRCDLAACLDRARIRLGVQVKEIAFHWKTDHGYVSRVLAGDDPLPARRLAELPDHIQRAVLEEWATDLQIVTGRRADLEKALTAIARLADIDLLELAVDVS